MAMTFARTEKQYYVHGFAGTFKDLKITGKDTLAEACRKAQDHNFGSTDCSLPMIYASQHDLEVDAFIVITDNETYAGRQHPSQALQNYRRKTGIDSKLIVIATSATQFSIADPKDNGMLDMVGFDAAAPNIISDFIRG
jgi:60 kDa SS-A/Ro ribonucleoprotein